jgi:hypothetical protein
VSRLDDHRDARDTSCSPKLGRARDETTAGDREEQSQQGGDADARGTEQDATEVFGQLILGAA